VPASGADGAD